MILFWAVAAGLFIGLLRKGTLRSLGDVDLRYGWLVFLSLLIQLLLFPLFKEEPIIGFWTPYFHGLSYFLVIIFTFLNLRIWQISIVGLGMFMNIAVIVANGGYMPASVEALREAGNVMVAENLSEMEIYGNLIKMGKLTFMDFLGDWLYLPHWLPLSNAFSLGDGLIGLGIIAFLADKMVGRRTKKNNST